jgi:hypothetical protein
MKKRGFVGVALVMMGVLGLMGMAGVIVALRVEGLKNTLAQQLGQAVGAKVEVSTLSLDFLKGQVDAAGITLENIRPGAPWDRGEIGQATIRFHWRDFFMADQPLEVEVDSWRLTLRPGGAATDDAAAESSGDAAPPAARAHGIAVTRLTGHNGEVEIELAEGRQVAIHGLSFDATNNGAGSTTWTTQVRMDSLTAGTLQAGAGSAQMRADPEELSFSGLHVQVAGGAITGEGQMARGGRHEAKAALTAVAVPVTMLVASPWQMKVSGLVNGTLHYEGSDGTAEARGDVALQQAKLNVLPFLGALGTMVGLPDISGVELDRATAMFAWKDGALHLTQIDVRKEGTVRIAGEADVDPNGQVDGRLKLGLPNALASKWPQLQTAVFATTTDDYSWTDVHLTGTPDHLQEDLSPRVLAVGMQQGGALLNQGAQQGGTLLNQDAQKAMDLLKGLMGP